MNEESLRSAVRRIVNLGDGALLAPEIERAKNKVPLGLITHGAGGRYHYDAIAGAAIAVLHARSHESLAATMTRLEQSASRLAKAALYLAGAQIVVVVIIAIVQIALGR